MKKFSAPLAIIFVVMALFNSCDRKMDSQLNLKQDGLMEGNDLSHDLRLQTKMYSSEVAFKWINMQLRLIRTNPTPLGGLPPQRYYAYSAIALYESVVPGMPKYQSLSGQLTNMPAMPKTLHKLKYYWPACGNAALAAMTRDFFTNATVDNKAAVDSLENALNDVYKLQTDTAVINRSSNFGKAVAQLVFNWSTTDGAAHANAPYTPPVGLGLWAPTPPAFLPAFGPYWGNNRLMVASSLDGVAPEAPPVYSEDPSSDFYLMVKEVYDVSLALTPEQKAIALFYRDNPGFGGGHYLSILKQVLVQENPKLDFTAYAFAKVSIAIVDAGIGCFKIKYQYNQQRPIKYIREVLGNPLWSPLFPTPNFPDFPSAHSVIAGAFGIAMSSLFGSDYNFTDHSYDYLGMTPRSFTSFDALVQEIGNSRVYAGIHYRISVERGAQMGKEIAWNMNHTLKFVKED
jgi:hypothetical protein